MSSDTSPSRTINNSSYPHSSTICSQSNPFSRTICVKKLPLWQDHHYRTPSNIMALQIFSNPAFQQITTMYKIKKYITAAKCYTDPLGGRSTKYITVARCHYTDFSGRRRTQTNQSCSPQTSSQCRRSSSSESDSESNSRQPHPLQATTCKNRSPIPTPTDVTITINIPIQTQCRYNLQTKGKLSHWCSGTTAWRTHQHYEIPWPNFRLWIKLSIT